MVVERGSQAKVTSYYYRHRRLRHTHHFHMNKGA